MATERDAGGGMTTGSVSYVRAEDLLDEPVPTAPTHRRGPGRNQRLAGAGLTVLGLPLLTLVLHASRGALSLESDVLLYLLAVVGISLVGGVVVALAAAFLGAALINWFFIEPLYSLDIGQAEQLVGLGVFLLVAGAVSGAMELATRRGREAREAVGQAETLVALAGAGPDRPTGVAEVLERARRTFGMESVTLLVRDRAGATWQQGERAGSPKDDGPLRFDVPAGRGLRLVGRGPALFAEDRRVLDAFAAAAETVWAGRRLSAQVEEARSVAVADRQRTALLAAVGHDLRTPLAGIKTAVSGLRQEELALTDEERRELLTTVEESADRLDAVLTNLLDQSRLQAGELAVHARPVSLDEVVGAALLALPGAQEVVRTEVPEEMPLVQADPGLLERVIVNLLDNAVRHAAGSGPVLVRADALSDAAKLEIVDHGPGVTAAEREQIFAPFRRLDDHRSVEGVGLGLAVARGFVEAMGGALVADASPGGGLTMRVRLPLAPSPRER